MHRIDAPGNLAGHFTDGDPANGVPATVVSGAWLDDVQENIVRAITDAGIALVKGNATQLSAAISALAQLAVGVPVGTVAMTACAIVPAGYLLCDGGAVSRTTYPALFTAIGTVHGAGDGSTTFNVPDFRGRGPLGAGAGVGLTSRALGTKLGEETHLLTVPEMPSHTHVQDAHTHSITTPGTMNLNGTENRGPGQDPTIQSGATVATNQNTGGGGAHNNMQPSTVVYFIIKT
jgi:microcystin-dependent protein